MHRRGRHDRHVEELVRVPPHVELSGRPTLGDPSGKRRRAGDVQSAHRRVVSKRRTHGGLASAVESEAVERRGEAPGAEGGEEHGPERAEARGLEELEERHARRRGAEGDGRPLKIFFLLF